MATATAATIASIMSPMPAFVAQTSTALEALETLLRYDAAELPVVGNQDQCERLVGSVSQLDLMGIFYGVDLGRSSVMNYVRPKPGMIESSESVASAADALLDPATHALFVMERGGIVGVLTRSNLFEAALPALGG
ncbi:MAG: CBS domain-containing protein [Pirellulaceae bacterium]|jgi:CBS domain-containing protein|nr:CBS domain-containing protein [Pirellulaceae bacterium]MDP7016898.1 CBS domain-containing protein [Pirellulaceae bacterium]